MAKIDDWIIMCNHYDKSNGCPIYDYCPEDYSPVNLKK